MVVIREESIVRQFSAELVAKLFSFPPIEKKNPSNVRSVAAVASIVVRDDNGDFNRRKWLRNNGGWVR